MICATKVCKREGGGREYLNSKMYRDEQIIGRVRNDEKEAISKKRGLEGR